MNLRAYFLTWDEVARIHRMGFEIGNHSWTHTDFGKAYLKQNGYRTLALHGLLQYYDSSHLPDDPLLKARCYAKAD